MSAPACYVIGAAEWHAFMEALGWALMVLLAAVWAAGVDWWWWLDRVRIHRRRLRLRAIRSARALA